MAPNRGATEETLPRWREKYHLELNVAAPKASSRDLGAAVAASSDIGRGQVLMQVGLWAGLLPIATGRWGSYIGLVGGNVYICDVLLAVGIFGLARKIMHHPNSIPRRTLLGASILGIYILAELLAGDGRLALRLRDLAPFLYLTAIPVFTQAVSSSSKAKVIRSLWLALWIHAGWAVPASFGLLDPAALPASIFGVSAFLLRKDYDGPVLIAGALFALAARNSQTRVRGALPLAIVSLAPIPVLGSRATVLGAISVFAYLTLLQFRFLIRLLVAPVTVITLSLLLSGLLLAAIVVPYSVTSNLLAQRLGMGGDSSAAIGAEGTTFGRRMAWKLVWESAVQDRDHLLFGWGPGAEILRDSGALKYLSGDPTVRAPHNGFLHLFARYGISGCLIWLGCLLLLLPAPHPRPPPPEMKMALRLLGGSMAAGLIAAATVGVILESPFGALGIYFGLTMTHLLRGDCGEFLGTKPVRSTPFKGRAS